MIIFTAPQNHGIHILQMFFPIHIFFLHYYYWLNKEFSEISDKAFRGLTDKAFIWIIPVTKVFLITLSDHHQKFILPLKQIFSIVIRYVFFIIF